jgi:serine/threonine protein kinase
LREARAMARLKHPNILTVYEVGTDRNRDYIAMELIDGDDLDAWLRTKPPRAEILAALFAAGRGLAAAHDAGLIHRDLKPHNILRGRDGSVYVTDFGLARGQIEDGAEVVQAPFAVTAPAIASGSHPRGVDSVLDSPLTQTGVLIGTPAYMAPEQFAGRAPDPRSDQFAFCVTAWEALTGARPFAGKNLEELRAAASAGVHRLGTTGELALPPRLRGVLVASRPTPRRAGPTCMRCCARSTRRSRRRASRGRH